MAAWYGHGDGRYTISLELVAFPSETEVCYVPTTSRYHVGHNNRRCWMANGAVYIKREAEWGDKGLQGSESGYLFILIEDGSAVEVI